MAKNPVDQFFQNMTTLSQSVQANISNFVQSLQNNQCTASKRDNASFGWMRSFSSKDLSRSPSDKFGDDFKGVETKSRAILETPGKQQTLGPLDASYSKKGSFQGIQDAVNGQSYTEGKAGRPVSKEELGRATWTLLHTLAAQFPNKPTKQQKRDAKELMAILSRIYPCKECADHFKEVLKANPVEADSGMELAQWTCRVHNVVNRSLHKPIFPCQRVDARWGALDCDVGACDLQGRRQ